MINTLSKCRLKPRHVYVGFYKKFFIVILAALVPQEICRFVPWRCSVLYRGALLAVTAAEPGQ